MKILHIAEPRGGVEKYLNALIFTTPNLSQIMVGPYSVRGADKNYNFEMGRSFNPFHQFQAAKSLRKIIKIEKPDVVYLHSSFAGIVGRIACFGLQCKVLYNPHGWSFDMKKGRMATWLFVLLERIFSHATDEIVLISEYEKQSALKHSICDPSKMYVLENAVNVEEILNDRTQSPLAYDEFVNGHYVVGMVGRIAEQKAPDVFVNAIQRISKKLPNAVFCIIGDGPMRAQITNQIKRLGLTEKVYISGWVADATPYVRKFDVGVLLSRWEGFGLSVTEYMLEEVPIVVTSAGNLSTFVQEGRSGIVVPIDDVEAATEAVIQLHSDPVEAKQMGKNGMKYVEEQLNENKFHVEYAHLLDVTVNA